MYWEDGDESCNANMAPNKPNSIHGTKIVHTIGNRPNGSDNIFRGSSRGGGASRAYPILFALSAAIFLSGVPSPSLAQQQYDFVSVVSVNVDFSNTQFSNPTINNFGELAFLQRVFDPVDARTEWVIFKSDGTTTTPFINLTDSTDFTGGGTPVINDNGDVGIIATRTDGILGHAVIRISPTGSVTTLAQSSPLGGGNYLEFESRFSMNNSGKIAVNARNNDGSHSILLLDDSGPTEIARSATDCFNLSTPSVNDHDVVSFKARDNGFESIFIGQCDPGTKEGVNPGAGTSGFSPVINNSGVTLSDGVSVPAVLYTAQGGSTTVLVVGDEDPVLNLLGAGYSFNNNGDFAFITQTRAGAVPDFGLFTGNDPVNDLVLRRGDIVFGGPVTALRMETNRSLNDLGQIVFKLQTGSRSNNDAVSHIVLATPVAGHVDCAVDGDGDVDRDDINSILAARNQPATGPDDPRDPDGDGLITVLDARQCIVQCTRPRCAIQ